MSKFRNCAARSGAVLFAALASLVLIVVPVDKAVADKLSTPVTVTNPSTSPALTSSVDDPGRVAYQSSAFGPSSCLVSSGCVLTFAVPTGHRLVVQHISGFILLSSAPSAVGVSLAPIGPSPAPFVAFLAPFAASQSQFDQPVLVYVDGGDTLNVAVSLTNAGFVSVPFINLSGYLLDCANIPCAPIAH
jgi:hypothetical protein